MSNDTLLSFHLFYCSLMHHIATPRCFLKCSGLPDDPEQESSQYPPGMLTVTSATPVDKYHPGKAWELLSSKDVMAFHQVDLLQLRKEFWSQEYPFSIKMSFDHMLTLTCLLLTKLFLTRCLI